MVAVKFLGFIDSSKEHGFSISFVLFVNYGTSIGISHVSKCILLIKLIKSLPRVLN